jgi:hypothetical protein
VAEAVALTGNASISVAVPETTAAAVAVAAPVDVEVSEAVPETDNVAVAVTGKASTSAVGTFAVKYLMRLVVAAVAPQRIAA